jgi:hypothetical protein
MVDLNLENNFTNIKIFFASNNTIRKIKANHRLELFANHTSDK